MSQATIQRAVNELEGPIRGGLTDLREMNSVGENAEAIDGKLIEVDGRVAELARSLAPAGASRDLPVEVSGGDVFLAPPLLFDTERPSGIRLEELLEQVIGELEGRVPGARHPREISLVITKLEEALHWERRVLELAGFAEFKVTNPKAV